MKISFVIKDKRLTAIPGKDKEKFDRMRNVKDGVRIEGNFFEDRSTAQHRMYRAILAFMRFSSEAISKAYPTDEALHRARKMEFCLMRPEYFVTEKVYYEGAVVDAKVPFSESPRYGIDSQGMNEYMSWTMADFSALLEITPEKLKQKSEEHAIECAKAKYMQGKT